MKRDSNFEKEGFVVIKEFLQHDEISVLKNQVENIIIEEREIVCPRPNNTLLSIRWNDEPVKHILKSERRIQLLCEAMDAGDLKFISGYISYKEPKSAELHWHQDWWCWQHPISFVKKTTQVALLCYLSSTNEENGALRVLPSSHYQRLDLHDFLHNDEFHLMKNHINQLTLNLNAGDAVIIDYRLLHSTHPNRTNTRRDCVMLTFTPCWKDLPNDIKGHLSQHYALPYTDEEIISINYSSDLLPKYNGLKNTLDIVRLPPKIFPIKE